MFPIQKAAALPSSCTVKIWIISADCMRIIVHCYPSCMYYYATILCPTTNNNNLMIILSDSVSVFWNSGYGLYSIAILGMKVNPMGREKTVP